MPHQPAPVRVLGTSTTLCCEKPCWYLVTTEDRVIPPAAQRAMADRAGASVSEIAASHAVYVSQPQVVADLIKQAAAAAGG